MSTTETLAMELRPPAVAVIVAFPLPTGTASAPSMRTTFGSFDV
jgi:hypothetical protein